MNLSGLIVEPRQPCGLEALAHSKENRREVESYAEPASQDKPRYISGSALCESVVFRSRRPHVVSTVFIIRCPSRCSPVRLRVALVYSPSLEVMQPEKAAVGEQEGLPELTSSPPSAQPEVAQRPSHAEAPARQNHLVFRYLREKKPLPSPRRARWIVWVIKMWDLVDPSAALYLIMTLAGWETGSSAPLLPFLQEYYNVSVSAGSEYHSCPDKLPSQ